MWYNKQNCRVLGKHGLAKWAGLVRRRFYLVCQKNTVYVQAHGCRQGGSRGAQAQPNF